MLWGDFLFIVVKNYYIGDLFGQGLIAVVR